MTGLGRPVPVLLQNQPRLQEPEEAERQKHDRGQPDCGMNPIGWLEQDFDDERASGNNRAHDQDDEDGSAITDIESRIIKSAGNAGFFETKISAVELAPSASRTSRAQKSGGGRSWRTGRRFQNRHSTMALAPQT